MRSRSRRRRRLLAFAPVAVLFVLSAERARADDLADEADLQFRIGSEDYQKGDFRAALEHFLASNRLVPNRNASFNVARSYEKLDRYPEAFRYYAAALDAETDAAARARIESAIDQIRPHVAVIDVETEPPGATIYVDRKDLGPRGESPRALGLSAGRYRIIAELPGYHAAEAMVESASLGATATVRLVLAPILGTLRVEGDAIGARVRIDDETGIPRCLVPCHVEVAPGKHVVHLALDGHRAEDVSVDVKQSAEVVIRPHLDELTGTVVVTTDEPGALIEVDGRPKGFTPSIVALPVGHHDLRISHRGFRTVKKSLDVVADRQNRVDEQLTQAEEVSAASRVSESVEDAPSSVTIISRQEIQAFGYPTIAEAVRGVPGMYVWSDRSYASLGVRGLGRPGSYTNRELVLADGHPTNDDWIGSAYVGYDARTDLADVDRIEVVRGPGSVLYGTNAFSGVVNLVSRYKDERQGTEAGLSAADYGVGRARVRAQANFGPDAGIWSSVSGAHGVGRDFYFPELATAGAPDSGHSRNSDGFDTGTLQGRAWWKWLTAQWFLHSQDKHLPTGEFDTLLGDPRTQQTDTRGFFEARAEPTLSSSVQLFSRLYWNLYRFHGDYARAPGDGGLEIDTFDGQWVGAEQRVVVTPRPGLHLTAGGEGQVHYQVKEQARDDSGYFLNPTNANEAYRVGAVYGLADAAISQRLRLSGGLRLDAYSTFGTSLNPRAAVIVKPYDGGVTKILGGRAFRAPSIYELHYNDQGRTQTESPNLRPESMYSFEVEHSHRFSPTVTGSVAVYANYVTDLIVSRGAGDPADPLHYANSRSPLSTLGADVGVRREWRQGWMIGASYSFQHSSYLIGDSATDLLAFKREPTLRHVENSPEHLASLKAAVPILSRALTAATRLTIEGPVYDRYESISDPPQGHTDPFVVWDIVLSGHEERWGLNYSIGAYNVTDFRYSAPVSNEFTQTTIVQNGRTFLASADVAF